VSTSKEGSSQHSPLVRLMDWWHEARQRWARLHELDQLDAGELSHLAEDVGVSPDDLVRLARQPDAPALLIEKRLAMLSLDPEEIRKLSPLLLRDLYRTCALCSEKARCADDMAEAPLDPGWKSYCPNSGTLRTLT
jgi:uncharacterized protein YjiS (DUF1127 family)